MKHAAWHVDESRVAGRRVGVSAAPASVAARSVSERLARTLVAEDGDPHPWSGLDQAPRMKLTMARFRGATDGRREDVVWLVQSAEGAASVGEALGVFDAFATSLERPSLGLRLRVRIRARALDEELARGASPTRTRELALRAKQLVAPQLRERLAAALENLVEDVERPPSISNIVPLPRREIIELRAPLIGLARRLRDPAPVYSRGAAMVSLLVRDGTGPAFTPGAGAALRRALRVATEALNGAGDDELVALG
jgi:hypothetical protein